jgi:DNA-binding CsgD family transcriptional regulator
LALAELCREAIGIVWIISTDARGVATCASVGVGAAVSGAAIDCESLRGRAHKLGAFPFVDTLSPTIFTQCGKMSDLDPSWRAGPIGRVWGDLARGEIAVGMGSLGEGTREFLHVQIAPRWTCGTPTPCIDMLRIALPLVVMHAQHALGRVALASLDWVSPREQQVLDLLTRGCSTKETAERLELSPHTVHDHVKSLHRKLGVSSRGELIARGLGVSPVHSGAQIEAKTMAEELGKLLARRRRTDPESK